MVLLDHSVIAASDEFLHATESGARMGDHVQLSCCPNKRCHTVGDDVRFFTFGGRRRTRGRRRRKMDNRGEGLRTICCWQDNRQRLRRATSAQGDVAPG
jgi:hypothetical protein